VHILEDRDNSFIIIDGNKVRNIAKTPFTVLRYRYFPEAGTKVIDEHRRVTFLEEEDIFILRKRNKEVQMEAKDLYFITSLQKLLETNKKLDVFFDKMFDEKFVHDHIEDILKLVYSRYIPEVVQIKEKRVIIHDLFAVSYHDGESQVKSVTRCLWGYLCLHPNKRLNHQWDNFKMYIDDGFYYIDPVTLTVLTKIDYLIHFWKYKRDRVFYNQVPSIMKKKLTRYKNKIEKIEGISKGNRGD